jgi:hypothetical protein
VNLGRKVVPPPLPPMTEQWVPHKKGMEISTTTGRLRTALPLPPLPAPVVVDIDLDASGQYVFTPRAQAEYDRLASAGLFDQGDHPWATDDGGNTWRAL